MPHSAPVRRNRRKLDKHDAGDTAGVTSEPANREEEVTDSGTESDEIDLSRVHSKKHVDSDESSDSDGDIQVDFDVMGPSEIDFKSVRRLLERYLPGLEKEFDVSAMAECIIAQEHFGTMVKVADDLDVYAFATVLPIHSFKDTKWMKQIKEWLISHTRDHAASKKDSKSFADVLRAFFDREDTALLISERVVNMPPELAPNIYESLLEDVKAAAGKGISIKELLCISPCFADAKEKDGEYFFYRFEEEYFVEQATYSSFVQGQTDSSDTSAAATKTAAKSGSKRKRAKDDSDDDDDDDDDEPAPLRPKQGRRVVIFPLAALKPSVDAMKHAVTLASEAVAADSSTKATASAKAPAKKKAGGKK